MGIVLALVGLGRALGVADLGLKVGLVLGLVFSHAVPEGPLGVGVNVHLDHSSLDGVLDVLYRRTRTPVEHKVHRLLFLAAELLRDVLLRVVENYWLQVDVARGVDTVHVAKGCGAREHAVRHLRELLVCVPHLLRLSVKARRVDIGVSTPSSSPPVTPSSNSRATLILAMRSRYFLQMAMFSSSGSSDKSSMCEENNGSPFSSKYFSLASMRPSIHGSHAFWQWSVWSTTGTP